MIRDGAGSVKSFAISGGWLEKEIRLFSQTTTKISLNNDLDWVEFLQDGVLVSMSEIYESAPKGEVWLLTTEGWRFVTEAEWEQRVLTRDWSGIEPSPELTPSPLTPTPSSSGMVSPLPVRAKTSPAPSVSPSSASQTHLQGKEASPLPYTLPTLARVSTQAAQVVASTSSGVLDDPSAWEEEVDVFLAWRQKGRFWASVLLFGGTLMSLSTIPRLVHCYNELTSCIVPFDSS